MDRNAEIARINNQLEILRTRYALYERWGNILRKFLKVWLPLFVVLMLAVAVIFFQFDAVYAIYFVGMMLVAGGFFWVINIIWPLKPLFWVDLASPLRMRSQIFPGKGFRSNAEIIEQQIAEHERRLTELGVRP
jgi:hypothetical protein